MAVYKIFVEKDSTVYSEENASNTGMDAILDLSKTPSMRYPDVSATSRAVLKFSNEDINKTITNYIGTGSYSTYLKLYLADTKSVPTDFSLEIKPLAEPWDMGTGHWGELPTNTTGVSWAYRSPNGTNPWHTASTGSASSFSSSNPGGGTWFTSSAAVQFFSPYTTKDIEANVTNIVKQYVSGSIPNNGFIIKNSPSIEFDRNYYYTLNYFSRDTSTIYPPVLEFRWDDSKYFPQNENNICLNGNVNLSLQNNKLSFNENSISKLRLNVREKFPVRVFSTGSLYTTQKYLPPTSYYSVLDYKTGDKVIDFDEKYTKISADESSCYLTLYLNGLEPTRYYKLLVKSVFQTETVVFDNDIIFKVD